MAGRAARRYVDAAARARRTIRTRSPAALTSMTSRTVNDLEAIRAQLRALANPALAVHATRFLKTGPGEYGEGDRFLGIRVPVVRRVAREHRDASVATMFALLRSPLHEERLLALLLLVTA